MGLITIIMKSVLFYLIFDILLTIYKQEMRWKMYSTLYHPE